MAKKNKTKKFWAKNKKAILKTLLLIVIIAIIAVSTFLILRACGFTSKEKWEELRNKLGENIWFWAIVVGMQVIQVIFVPISNSLISAPLALIFTNDLWKLFLASWIGISIGTVILYFLGKFGGEKISNWILSDKKKTKKMKDLMQKGKAFFVIGDLIPFIPNDILTFLSGLAGYNFIFVLVVTLLTRAACIATTIYIFGYITTYPWLIAVLIVLLAFMIFAAVYVTKRQIKKEKKPNKKLRKKDIQAEKLYKAAYYVPFTTRVGKRNEIGDIRFNQNNAKYWRLQDKLKEIEKWKRSGKQQNGSD